MDKKEHAILVFERIASTLSVLMYVSYIPQTMNNLAGNKGNPIQPRVALTKCIFWVIYASLQKKQRYTHYYRECARSHFRCNHDCYHNHLI